MSVTVTIHLIIAYLLGAIPWSVWISKWMADVDPRLVGDGNPGATNTFKAAGPKAGVVVIVLDFLKAAIPVGIANFLMDYSNLELIFIAIAPTIGHGYSIFLRGQGGRGIVSLFGVWSGLTLYQMPLSMGMGAITSLFLTENDELRTFAVPTTGLLFLLLVNAPWWMIAVIVLQFIHLMLKVGHYLATQATPEDQT